MLASAIRHVFQKKERHRVQIYAYHESQVVDQKDAFPYLISTFSMYVSQKIQVPLFGQDDAPNRVSSNQPSLTK